MRNCMKNADIRLMYIERTHRLRSPYRGTPVWRAANWRSYVDSLISEIENKTS